MPRTAWALITGEPLERRADPEGILDESPLLLAYLRAALVCGIGEATFWWLDGAETLRVDLVGRADADAGLGAVVPRGGAVELTAAVEPLPFGLTRRELQVLTLLAGGLSNAEAGARLGTGARTVASQVEQVLTKLDQTTRAGAAAVAAEHGALCLPVPGGGASLAGLAVGRLQQAVEGGRVVAGPRSSTIGSRGSARGDAAPSRPRRRSIVLGSVFPAGADGGDGDEMRKGASLAVADLNWRGGIAGRTVEHVVVEVTDSSASETVRGLHELFDQQVDGITLGYVSERAGIPGVIELAAQPGCPVLHSCTAQVAADVVRDDPHRFGSIFQVGPPETLYADGFLRFLDGLRAAGDWQPPNRRLVVLEPMLGMPVAREETFDRAARAGWQIELIDRTAVEAGEAPRRIRALEPAAVLVPSLIDDEALLLEVLDDFRAEPIDCLLYAVYTPSMPGFVQRAGERAEGLVWSTVIGRGADVFSDRFSADFSAAFGRTPGMSQAGLQYDSVQLLASAWRAVDSPRRFGDVAASLRRQVHRGVSGAYWLDAPGQSGLAYPDMTPDPSIAHPHLVLQLRGGAHRTLAPSPYADARFVRQPWMGEARTGRARRQPAGVR